MDKAEIKQRFPRVVIETARGKAFFYHRIGKGKRVRLPGDPTSPEFAEAYRAAEAGGAGRMPEIAIGTVEWLIESYRRSHAYKSLSANTKREREHYLTDIQRQSGAALYGSVTRDHVADIVRSYQNHSNRKTARKGRRWLSTMKALFDHATNDLAAEKRLKVSPCDGVKYPKVEKPKKANGAEGHVSWSEADITAYRERWQLGTRERLYFEAALFTGLRRADLVRVGEHHVVDGVIELPTQKSGLRQTAYIPMTAEFRAILDASPIGKSEGSPWLLNAHKRPLTAEVLGNAFIRARKEAGVRSKALHGVRRTSAEIDFMADVSVPETMAKHGWKTPTMAFHYGQGFDRRRLAMAAAAKRKAKSLTPSPNTLENAPNTASSV